MTNSNNISWNNNNTKSDQVWHLVDQSSCEKDDTSSTKETIQQIYSGVAELYHEFRPKYPESLIDLAIEQSSLMSTQSSSSSSSHPLRILEIGCGPGTMTIPLALRGFSITALDPGKGMIEKAKQVIFGDGDAGDGQNNNYNTNIQLLETTLKNFQHSETEEPFDAIVAASSLHWALAEHDKSAMIQKLHDLLKDNGSLILFWNFPPEPVDQTLLNKIGQALNQPLPFYFGNGSYQQHRERLAERVLNPVEESQLFTPFITNEQLVEDEIPISSFVSYLKTLSTYIAMTPEEQESFYSTVETILRNECAGGTVLTQRYSIFNISQKISNETTMGTTTTIATTTTTTTTSSIPSKGSNGKEVVWNIIMDHTTQAKEDSDKETVQQLFNSVADLYYQYRPRYPKSMIDAAIQQSPLLVLSETNDQALTPTILEIGCGPGVLTLPLAERGYHIVAMDPGKEMIAKAKQVIDQHISNAVVEFHETTLKEFQTNQTFHAIVAGASIHWALADANKDALIQKLHDLLQPMGTIVLFWTLPEPLPEILDKLADALQVPKPFYFTNASFEYHMEQIQEIILQPMEQSKLFTPFRIQQESCVEEWPIQNYINFLKTQSTYIAMVPKEHLKFFTTVETTLRNECGDTISLVTRTCFQLSTRI